MIYYGQSDFCGGVWMHPRSVLFSGFNYDYDYDICLVTGTVCYTCLSQFLGVRYSTHLKNEDTPHIIWLSERTPLYMIMKNYGIDGLYDMICFGLVVDDYPFFFLFYYSFIYSLFYFPNALYFSSVSLSLLCICICSLGFLSSAAFPFPAAGFSRKLGYGKRVWLDLEDYALD